MNARNRQRPIPVTASEREVLDLMKVEVERRLSMHLDWGEFLTMTVAIGVSRLQGALPKSKLP
jgi:hypothetical protein